MAKSLRDIVVSRAGRNVPKGEEEFLDKHTVDEKPYPNSSDQKVYSAKVVKPEASIQKNDPGMRHGYRSLKAAEKAYEETMPKSKKKKDGKGLSKEDDRNINAPSYSTEYMSSGSSLKSEAKDQREYGYEGDMAMSQLKSIMNHCHELMEVLKPDTDLPEWVQSKITLASDYIQTAADYMSTEMDEEKKKTKKTNVEINAKTFPDMDDRQTKVESTDVNEVLKKSDPTKKWIKDFVHSDNPRFKGKSKEERINMALGAKYAKMKEETEVEEGVLDTFVKAAGDAIVSGVATTTNQMIKKAENKVKKTLGLTGTTTKAISQKPDNAVPRVRDPFDK